MIKYEKFDKKCIDYFIILTEGRNNSEKNALKYRLHLLLIPLKMNPGLLVLT